MGEVVREGAPFPLPCAGDFLIEILHGQGKDGAVRAVQEKGLADEPNLSKIERGMDDAYIRHEFEVGVYEVPCCRLEFQRFDDHLKVTLGGAPTRRARLR